MKPLVSSGFSYYQDTLTGSISKLYIVTNIDTDQHGKKYCNQFFAISPSPTFMHNRIFLSKYFWNKKTPANHLKISSDLQCAT